MRRLPILICLLALFVTLSLAGATPVLGQEVSQSDDAPTRLHLTRDLGRPLVLSIVFTVIGVALFAASIWVMVKVAPFPIIREIEEDQNVALAIIMAAVILGLAMILCAAMLG